MKVVALKSSTTTALPIQPRRVKNLPKILKETRPYASHASLLSSSFYVSTRYSNVCFVVAVVNACSELAASSTPGVEQGLESPPTLVLLP